MPWWLARSRVRLRVCPRLGASIAVIVLLHLVQVGERVVHPAFAQSSHLYEEVFYKSGNLKIQAYLYKPEGNGPFPVVIYNHGSRIGRERQSDPHRYIGELLTQAGFAVLVPERRGYGRSDGTTWSQEVGQDASYRFLQRLESETDDVLAAIEYLRTVPSLDPKRLGIMGWSLGGIITMFAISRSNEFRVAINQAGGALTWDRLPALRLALIDAAQKTTTPVLLLVAKNDRTTDSVTTLAERLQARNVPHKLVIYDSFTPSDFGGASGAPGHRIFGRQGTAIWRNDVVDYLGGYLFGTDK